jgi:acetyl esterase/lipase
VNALFLVMLAFCQGEPDRAGPAESMGAELRAAIELAVPKERRSAALAVAKRKEATLANLQEAIRIASLREPAAAGTHEERANVWADGDVEDVELVTYVPKSYDPETKAPLLVVLHWTGGSARRQDELWRDTCEKIGAVLVAPGEAGANEGYGWTMRERDAAIGAMRFAMSRFAIDPDRVFATGISRGGHLAWDVALRRPDRFAALAPFIGCPRFQLARGQNNLRFLENVLDLPIRDLQGMKDDPLAIENLKDAFARLEKMHAKDAKLIEFEELGHAFEFGAVDWPEFFGAAKRDPMRDQVVFTSANLAEARAFWVEIVLFTKETAENPRIDVPKTQWESLDARGQRALVQERFDQATARIDVKRVGKGRFEAEGRGVAKFRLLLADGMFDPAVPVEITWQGKTHKRRANFDPRLMVTDFVERLDTSFVPVASVEVP